MCNESPELQTVASGFFSWASGFGFCWENFGGNTNRRSSVRDEISEGYKKDV